MHDLTLTFMDFPQIIYSSKAMNAILRQCVKIMQDHHDTDISFEFIQCVCDQFRCKAMGGFKVDDRELDQLPPHDWPWHVLTTYLRTCIQLSGGECLENQNIQRAWELTANAKMKDESSPYQYLGMLFFIFDYSCASITNDRIFREVFSKYFIKGNAPAWGGMLDVFTDTRYAVSETAVQKLIDVCCRFDFYAENDLEYLETNTPLLVRKLKKQDIGWLNEQLNGIHPDVVVEIDDLFIQLGNAMQSLFAAQGFFYEYIAEISYFYPLTRQRADTVERYERYFGEETVGYMADITSACMDVFSNLSSYRGKDTKVAERIVARKLEDIIMQIHQSKPDIPAEVVRCFLKDVFDCFGRGYRGITYGMGYLADPIIDAVFSAPATESYEAINYLDLCVGLEADIEDIGETAASQSGNLHQKAKTKTGTAAAQSMKSAERKIFNAYHKYKSSEQKVDQTLAKGVQSLKRAITGDQQKILIEGKPFSPIGFLKKVLLTVGIFNYSKIALILGIIVSKTMKGKAKKAEKRKLLMELEEELNMVNEKIEDARGDGNRQAKYDLMRTRNALQNAIKRLKYGIGAEEKDAMHEADRLRSTQNYEDANYRG